MRLSLKFGMAEPTRQCNWWQHITKFPYLVLYKGRKYEFVMYDEDPSGQVDYICRFSEVPSYDPNWHATIYQDIDHLFDEGYGEKCACGAAYTSFPQIHMFFCPKWSKI